MKTDSKTIKVTCTGAAVLDHKVIKPLQGNLKELSKENYEKLKGEILRHGFSFPLFVWKSGKEYFSVDGHQRLAVIGAMAKDGYAIPKLPVDWIQAKDKREAKEKILAAVSQYGHITEEGLYEFTNTAGIKFEDFKAFTDLPGINFDRYEAGYVATESEAEVPDAQHERAKELVKEYGIERGQIWALGNHRLMCGDSTNEGDVKRLMGGGRKQDYCFQRPSLWHKRGRRRRANKVWQGRRQTNC